MISQQGGVQKVLPPEGAGRSVDHSFLGQREATKTKEKFVKTRPALEKQKGEIHKHRDRSMDVEKHLASTPWDSELETHIM